MKTIKIKAEISTKDGKLFIVRIEDQNGGGVGNNIPVDQLRFLFNVVLEDNILLLQE